MGDRYRDHFRQRIESRWPGGWERLEEIAAPVGSDVPFCVRGGTALAEGRGDLLTDLPPLPDCRFVICKPDFDLPTGPMFARLRFDGDLVINYSDRTLRFQGREIPLAKKEFDILAFLSQNPGLVFDKDRIYERVWSYDSEGDSSVVAEHIRRIRGKLAAAGATRYIETVWGCGYRWSR